MSGEFDDTVKQGYVRLRSRHLGVWQRRWIIFKKASSAGTKRLEKFVDEKAAIGGGLHKVILLDTVTFVARLLRESKRHGFVVTFSAGPSRQFCCESEMEADDWCKALALELCPEHCGIATGEPDILMAGLHMEQTAERFHVYLIPCAQLSVSGECTLQVTDENIYLWDIFNPRHKLVTWPLHALRRYGRDSSRFTFESGRFCETGDGLFTVKTTQGEAIYQRVHNASLAIAEALEKARLEKKFSSKSEMKVYNPMASAMSSNSSPISRHMSPQSPSSNHMSPHMSPSIQHHARRTPMLQKAQSFHLPLDKSPYMSPHLSPSIQHNARRTPMLQKAQSFHLPLDSPTKKPYAVFTSSPRSSQAARVKISPSHSQGESDSGVDVSTESNTPTSETTERTSPESIARLRIAKGSGVCNVGTCSCGAHSNEDIWVRRNSLVSRYPQPSVPTSLSIDCMDFTSDTDERSSLHTGFLSDSNLTSPTDSAIVSTFTRNLQS